MGWIKWFAVFLFSFGVASGAPEVRIFGIGMLAGNEFAELHVEAFNPGSAPLPVTLRWRSLGSDGEGAAAFRLAPGENRSFGFLVSSGSYWNPQIQVESGGMVRVRTPDPMVRGNGFFSNDFSERQVKALQEYLDHGFKYLPDFRALSGDGWSGRPGVYLGSRFLLVSRQAFDALSEPVREALLDYARLGGALLISEPDRKTAERERAGFGSVVLCPPLPVSWGNRGKEGAPPDSAAWLPAKQAVKSTMGIGNYFPAGSSDFFNYRIALYPAGVWFLMLAFVLAAGPLAYWRLARRGKLVHLLWILPAASLLFSGAVFLVAGFSDGWRPRIRTASLTFLDQRSGRAVSAGKMSVCAPLWGMSELVYPEGQIVRPENRSGRELELLPDQGIFRYRNVTEGRNPTLYGSCRSRLQKERLAVRELPDGRIEVENRLGVPVSELRLVGPDRRIYNRREPLLPGETAQLAASSVNWSGRAEPEVEWPGVFARILSRDASPFVEAAFPGRYVVRMERNPFLPSGTDRVPERDSNWLIGDFRFERGEARP